MRHVISRCERPMPNGRWLYTCACGQPVQAPAGRLPGEVVAVGPGADRCPKCFHDEAPDPMTMGQMFRWAPDPGQAVTDPTPEHRVGAPVTDPGYRLKHPDEMPPDFRIQRTEREGDRVLGRDEWSWG